jgi:hypothetical protein
VTPGQIVTILMRPAQGGPLADLEWLVLPAILHGQYRVAQAQQSGIVVPVGGSSMGESNAVDQRAFGFVRSMPLAI